MPQKVKCAQLTLTPPEVCREWCDRAMVQEAWDQSQMNPELAKMRLHSEVFVSLNETTLAKGCKRKFWMAKFWTLAVLQQQISSCLAFPGRFTTVRLRGRRTECVACGSCPAITRDNLAAYDYVAFTGQAPTDAAPSISVLPPSLRVTPQQLQVTFPRRARPDLDCAALISSAAASGRAPPAVLDVRPASQFCLMHLPHATHIPFEQLDAKVEEVKQLIRGTVFEGRSSGEGAGSGEQSPEAGLYVMCRRGNNSQLAVARLRELGVLSAVDVVGGMENWAESLDPSMPVI
eukprot:scaffold8774_cov19-Tisochrysis_lutea.AAC.1